MLKGSKRFFCNKWLRWTLGLLACWLLLHLIYISIDGLHDNYSKADVAIILGNRVYRDGSLSSWLKGRVDKALALYKEGQVKLIFASSGISTKEDGGYPEGDAIKKYLVAHGVPEQDVVADNLGQNTYLTAKNFLQWNKSHHYASIIVVSQFYHITRTKYIFHKLGFENVFSASSTQYSWRDILGTLREVPAFYKYVIAY
jgi:vancomycin permeability regulator SanA